VKLGVEAVGSETGVSGKSGLKLRVGLKARAGQVSGRDGC